MEYFIRKARPADTKPIQLIARKYRDELGFVMQVSIDEHIAKGEVFICEHNRLVVGFVDFHTRRDGVSVIYHLAVHPSHTGKGVGRQLLYSVPASMRLKVAQDNATANRFYRRAGMRLEATETGRKRPLNVYAMQRLNVFVKGRNPRYPAIARKAGMAYGVRNDYKADAWPFMLDIHWSDYDWVAYMALVRQYRPVMAMAPDYEHHEQRRQLHQQIQDLREAGVLRIMVCPKFPGAVADIPQDCIIAVSVMSEYAGYEPNPKELVGRKLHLLGGGTDDHLRCIDKYHEATVQSVDGSMFTIWADYGRYWKDGKQHEIPYHLWQRCAKGKNYKLALYSARNIVREVGHYHPLTIAQMPLWA